MLTLSAAVVSGCGAAAGGGNTLAVSHNAAGDHNAGCATSVNGVVPGPGSLTAGWLPLGFQLTGGGPSDLTSAPVATYSSTAGGADPQRVQLNFSYHPAPLGPAVGGKVTAAPVEVQGHAGLIESGPPAPEFIGVYWKPAAADLLSVVGYKVPALVVVKVAQHLGFDAPGMVTLPLAPGPIATRSAAIAAARRGLASRPSAAMAKLSSWTEILSLAQAGNGGTGTPTVPSGMSGTPWQPVWVVLLTTTAESTGAGAPAPSKELVVVDAATGQTEFTAPTGVGPPWYPALTDRDPSLAGCPGGTTARLPFGVLTRDEEAYTMGAITPPGATGDATSTIVKLTTVPVLNQADPGLFGSCLRQNCALHELVWPTITVVRAPPGKTLACLPAWASYPFGYRPKQVKQYVTIAVAGSSQIVCGTVPGWINQLEDLAPPAAR